MYESVIGILKIRLIQWWSWQYVIILWGTQEIMNKFRKKIMVREAKTCLLTKVPLNEDPTES